MKKYWVFLLLVATLRLPAGTVAIKNMLGEPFSVQFDTQNILGTHYNADKKILIPAQKTIRKNLLGMSFANIYFYNQQDQIIHHIDGPLPKLHCIINMRIDDNGVQRTIVECPDQEHISTGSVKQAAPEKIPEQEWLSLQEILE